MSKFLSLSLNFVLLLAAPEIMAEDSGKEKVGGYGLSLAIYSLCYTLNPTTQATQPKQRNPNKSDVLDL